MKPLESNIFSKSVLFIFVLLLPLLLLFGYSNDVSVRVVRQEINQSGANQMSFFLSQVDAHVEQLATNAVMLSRDPAVREFPYLHLIADWYDSNRANISIQDKLYLQSVSDSWSPQFTLYAPESDRFVSTDLFETYDREKVAAIGEGWIHRVRTVTRNTIREELREFVWAAVSPIEAYADPLKANLIVETSFAERNLVDMLDRFKSGGKGDPYFFSPEGGVVVNRTADEAMVGRLNRQLAALDPAAFGSRSLKLGGRDYMVKVMRSETIGWYLVDYVPLKTIMEPIARSRNLFYASTALVLAIGLLAAFLQYRHVRVPLREMTIHVQKLKRGDFSSRIAYRAKNEFMFLIQRFNEMADQIQQLIESVLQEKIRSRDARLKQLQSQINPHFLYNCLFFIKNMARIGDEEAVVRMSLSLAEYFRYSTRLDLADARIEEETALVENYLTIQRLRMKRIRSDIAIPEEMRGLTVPRLLLQPVVENAIVHGLESLEEGGWIRIRGERDGEACRLVVEDSGGGLSEEGIRALTERIGRPIDETTGFGLWNVHQRLLHRFGEGAGLKLSPSSHGGLRVELRWRYREERGDSFESDSESESESESASASASA